jgi:hypothetical protein
MIVAFLFFCAEIAASFTETPLLACELSFSMCNSQKIDWTKMEDDEGNVKYTITLYKFPKFFDKKFEKTLLEQNISK